MMTFKDIRIDFQRGVDGFLSDCGLLISFHDEDVSDEMKEKLRGEIQEAKKYYWEQYEQYKSRKFEAQNHRVRISFSKTKTVSGKSVFNKEGKKIYKSEYEHHLEKAGDRPLAEYVKERLRKSTKSSKNDYVVPNVKQIQSLIDLLLTHTKRIQNEDNNFTFILNRVKERTYSEQYDIDEYKRIADTISKLDQLYETIDLIERTCHEPEERTLDFIHRKIEENPILLEELRCKYFNKG